MLYYSIKYRLPRSSLSIANQNLVVQQLYKQLERQGRQSRLLFVNTRKIIAQEYYRATPIESTAFLQQAGYIVYGQYRSLAYRASIPVFPCPKYNILGSRYIGGYRNYYKQYCIRRSLLAQFAVSLQLPRPPLQLYLPRKKQAIYL